MRTKTGFNDRAIALGRIAVFSLLLASVALAGADAPPPPATTQRAAPSPRQSLQILEQATADYRGTRQDHVAIQDALRTLNALVTADEQYHIQEQVSASAPVEKPTLNKKRGK